MYRTRRDHLDCSKSEKTSKDCPLCTLDLKKELNEENNTMRVVINLFPYSHFEWRNVVPGGHFMIIPKRHVELLEDFNSEEKSDYFDLLQKYEKDGFNLFQRGNGESNKSIKGHLHMHLIKSEEKPFKLFFGLTKPWIILKK